MQKIKSLALSSNELDRGGKFAPPPPPKIGSTNTPPKIGLNNEIKKFKFQLICSGITIITLFFFT